MKTTIATSILAFTGWACVLAVTEPVSYDLVVYGGTPAGITAAIAAAR
jgi:alkyl hydroperoxide reductase subunit AhpF